MQNIQHRATLVLTELKRLFPTSKTILEFSNNIELLFAVMLSAQTTDVQVNKVTKNLFQKYKTLDDYMSADPIILETDLNSVNYYKTKATYIQKTAKILKEKYAGILPKTVEEMLELPGVGRKTAVVVLGNAYNITAGIAVDTHVKRLSKVFDLTKHDDTQKIEQDLQQLFPKDEWFLLTNRMIEYGRKYCSARCTHEYCPIYAKLNRSSK